MKKLLFVSTGRCGTKRIAQILGNCLPDQFSVVHQMPFSRLANVVGNLLYYCGPSEKVQRALYDFIILKYCRAKHFICSDPLTAMIIPKVYVHSAQVCIVHIVREPESFADSFFKLSRREIYSLIAHNFVPFWQIGLWPLENLLNQKIKKKYVEIAKLKNTYFAQTYSANPNYVKIKMSQIFNSDFLSKIIVDFFGYQAVIPTSDLSRKAN
jgi:hypothetical protein